MRSLLKDWREVDDRSGREFQRAIADGTNEFEEEWVLQKRGERVRESYERMEYLGVGLNLNVWGLKGE